MIKFNVSVADLKRKLNKRLGEYDSLEEYNRQYSKVMKELNKEALADMKKNPDGVEYTYDSYRTHGIKICYKYEFEGDRLPEKPKNTLSDKDKQALTRAIEVLDMVTDTTITITEKDDYFKWL